MGHLDRIKVIEVAYRKWHKGLICTYELKCAIEDTLRPDEKEKYEVFELEQLFGHG